MAETPNIGLYVIDPNDTTTNTMEWVCKLSATDDTSNMMLLDALIYALQTEKANRVVEDTARPASLAVGDEWDQLLDAGELEV